MSSETSQTINDWLIAEGAKCDGIPGLVADLAGALNRRGLGLMRAMFMVHTLHPEIESLRFTWTPVNVHLVQIKSGFYLEKRTQRLANGDVEEVGFLHGAFSCSMAYRKSPFVRLDQGEKEVRARVGGEYAFDLLNDLRAAGGTDYFLLALPKVSGLSHRVSWSTSKPGGFTDADLELLRSICPQLAMVLEIQLGRLVTQTLLSTYLGVHTGEKVLSGKIRPGDIAQIDAGIWFSDLRGFTEMSEKVESSVLVSWLNEYFEAIARPITDHGGEILKFIGDAVLAIFPVEKGEKDASERSLGAARLACKSLKSLNDRRAEVQKPPLRHGIALHMGAIQYGNIGANRRLDFTVIGQSVNLASRIEGLCKTTGSEILCSGAIAQYLDGLKPLGTFPLKGIREPQAVFGADESL